MTLEEAQIDLADVRNQIDEKWNHTNGAGFQTTAANGVIWNVAVPPHNRKDCWATKAGTDGKQYRTFYRFHTERDDK